MTSTKLLLYNCFIMLLCSLDNNGVADVFVIIWLFFFSPPLPSFACYQRLQVIVEKIMTACLPACPASSRLCGLRIANSLTAAETIAEAAGLLFSCLAQVSLMSDPDVRV